MRRALEGLAGVDRAKVDLDSGEATVAVSGRALNRELLEAVEGKVIFARARAALARLSGEGS